MADAFHCIIYGEPASKANSRRQVPGITKAGKRYTRTIKSEPALVWLQGAAYQVPMRSADKLLQGRLAASMRIWYASDRPDLDESLVLDFLQGRAYSNDRQVRQRHVYHGLDKRSPRVEVLVTAIDDMQPHLRIFEQAHQVNMMQTPVVLNKRKRATTTNILPA